MKGREIDSQPIGDLMNGSGEGQFDDIILKGQFLDEGAQIIFIIEGDLPHGQKRGVKIARGKLVTDIFIPGNNHPNVPCSQGPRCRRYAPRSRIVGINS